MVIKIGGFGSTWKTIPCNFRFARVWICQHRLKSVVDLSSPSNSFVACCKDCIMISHHCYQICYIKVAREIIFPRQGKRHKYITKMNNVLSTLQPDRVFRIVISNRQHNVTKKYGEVCKLHAFALVSTYDLHANTSSTENLVLIRSGIKTPNTCADNQHRCMNGSCILPTLLCISDQTCDPNHCMCYLRGRKIENLDFCKRYCTPTNCTCGTLMFQCTGGGCVPYTLLCDGEPNCVDASDEFCTETTVNKNMGYDLQQRIPGKELLFACIDGYSLCLGFRCKSGDCMHLSHVNDLIPDCPGYGAEDEVHGLSIKYHNLSYGCVHEAGIACLPGHSKCFEVNQLCLYDTDESENTAFCRNAAHLRDCDWIECTNSFKCYKSYCIPFRLLCNGREECLEGDDEKNCDNYNCPSFLKCSGVNNCVHPTEVCDGTSHCPYGDDERLCDIQHCPSGCQCLGYSVACYSNKSSFIPHVPTRNLKLLSFIFPSMFIPNLSNLTSISRLLILDMSNCDITNICRTFTAYSKFYDSLKILDLQFNDITYISPKCFSQLTSLIVLNLRGNSLMSISDDSFQKAPLRWLIISYTNMYEMSGQWLQHLGDIMGIDLRGVQIKSFNLSPLRHLAGVEEIMSEDIRLCCLLTDKGMCKMINGKLLHCLRILPSRFLAPVLLTTAALLLLWVGLSVAVVVSMLYSNRPVYVFTVACLMTGELLCSIYMLTIAAVDLYYGKQYVLAGTSWVNSVLCHGLSVVISTGLSLSVITDSLITHLSYKVVMSMVFKEHYFQRKMKYTLLSFSLVPIIYVVIEILEAVSVNKDARESYCAMLYWSYEQNIPSLIRLTIMTTFMVISLVHTFITNGYMFVHVYSTGRQAHVSSFDAHYNQRRLFRLTKNILSTFLFKLTQCLPMSSIAVLRLQGIVTPQDINLTILLLPIIIGAIRNPFIYVWVHVVKSNSPGPRLNIKTVLSTYGDFHVKDKTAVRTSYL